VINILDFGYIPLDDFHTSFHLYEDRHKDYMLTDALEMHYIDMVRRRELKGKDYSEPIHRKGVSIRINTAAHVLTHCNTSAA
jgi:hypothetical protein